MVSDGGPDDARLTAMLLSVLSPTPTPRSGGSSEGDAVPRHPIRLTMYSLCSGHA